MNINLSRRSFLGGAGALGLGAAVTYALQPTQAEIDDLAATVEDLDSRVSVLETQAASEPAAGDAANADTSGSNSAASGSGDWLTVEGVGQTVSEKFELAEGTYRVHASVQSGGTDAFSVQIYSESGDHDYLFIELIQQAGEWTGSIIYQAMTSDHYYLEVGSSSPWSLQFESY